jgi:hypothetical protein
MSKIVNYPESYKPSFQISPQLIMLSKQLGLDSMRDTIEPDITDREIDELLEKIEIESGRKRYLMEIVRSIIDTNKISDPVEIMNIKIQVLLDNLGKKLCRCTEKDRYTEGYNQGDKLRSKEGLCRRTIFQDRNLDYITHDCGEPPEDRLRYKYGLGPLLRPSVSSDSKIILKRYKKKNDTLPESDSSQFQTKAEPFGRQPEIMRELETSPKLVESRDVKSCTINANTGRCVLGEPNMPSKCVYNSSTKRCNKI